MLNVQNETVTPWFGAIMHYKLFEWWDLLINGHIHNYKPDPRIIDLNPYVKPIFTEANGGLNINVHMDRATI